jgi:ketosteroid isomerase-like protein
MSEQQNIDVAAIVDITRFETKEFIAPGDRVVVIGDGTEKVKATGRAVEFQFAHVFSVRDGKGRHSWTTPMSARS